MDRAKNTLEIKAARYVENNYKMDTFTTLDIYIAGYLEASGFTVSLKENFTGRITFSIALTDEVKAALADFPTAFVQAKPYAATIKELKKRMYNTKDNKQGEGLRQNGKDS
jgi:hypothetical protein